MKTLRHKKQRDFLRDPARFKFLLAGRRGGKTVGIREDILRNIARCPDNGKIFYIGPTNQSAKELIWDDLEDRLDELGWTYDAKPSKSRFEFSRGRKLYIIGAEKIRRIRGHKVFRAYLDEIAFFTTDLAKVWRAVRPALSDLKGHAIVATTPDGKGTQAYQFYRAILEKKQWKYFSWDTEANPYIDPQEIEEAKDELDEKSFNQEYRAMWISFEGLAYYNFNESTHITKCAELDTANPVVFITFDFNVNPTSLLVGQQQNNKLYFRKEYSLTNSSTPATMRAFCEDHKHLANHIQLEVYGDATGDARRSNTGTSDYDSIKEILNLYKFNYVMKVPASNPPVVDRVGFANAWLKNARGVERIEVDPSCTELITDLSSQTLEGRMPSDKNNRGHKADAFGYRIWWAQVVGARGPQRTIQL